MKNILFVCLILFSFNVNAQKVKLKKGVVYVDKAEWIKFEGCRDASDFCSLKNLDDEEIIFIKYVRFGTNTLFNDYGKQNYNEISFLGTGKKIEIREFDKKIIKIIFNSGCINEDGTFDEEKLDRLVEKYGTSFSEN